MLDLNDLPQKADIDPKSEANPVLVARHSSPISAKLAALRLSATGDRAHFETYQSTQRKLRRENQIAAARYMVSFIANRVDTAVPVGLYRIGAQRQLSALEYRALPHMDRLLSLDPAAAADVREGILLFDLQRQPTLDAFHDRLEISFSSPRNWLRNASSSRFPIAALHPEPVLAPVLPRWDTIVFSVGEIEYLPPSWRAAMSQWRGIYCITDNADGKSYVGSASGAENILQRWVSYAATGHGGNAQLLGRNPERFRFCVLELVSPSLPRTEVIGLEEAWMRRLQTRLSGLNGPVRRE